MIKREDILKESPEYEEYDKNEVKLSIQELKELGIIKCGGCSSKKQCSSCKCTGKGCCKTNLKLEIKK